MSTCHISCLTCSSSLFNQCISCPIGLSLSNSACFCNSVWGEECTKCTYFSIQEYNMRGLIETLAMLIQLVLVAVMVLYSLRARLPLSYRIWSGANALSLLIYNQIFYLFYDEERGLGALAISNGPYFASYRIMELSTSHIFPTIVLLILMISLLLLGYFPLQTFTTASASKLDYFKTKLPMVFDTAYFLCCRMMYFFIGKLIQQSSTLEIPYIIIAAVYGIFLLIGLGRTIYLYHSDNLDNFAYDAPIYLYTMIAPVSLIGLAMVSSKTMFVVVYCSPFALLLLILLLNRNMKILSFDNIKFFVVEALMVALTLTFVFLPESFRVYLLVAILFFIILAIFIEILIQYLSGYNFSKVYPEQQKYEPRRSNVVQTKKEKDGYF